MDLAHGQAVWDDRLSVGFPVLDDVGGIQQLDVPEPADRAAAVVGEKHLAAKHALMEAALVSARRSGWSSSRSTGSDESLALVQRKGELEVAGSSPTTHTG